MQFWGSIGPEYFFPNIVRGIREVKRSYSFELAGAFIGYEISP